VEGPIFIRMSNPRLKALLAIPSFSLARDVGKMLNDEPGTFEIAPVQSFAEAQKRFMAEFFDVVLVSLSVLDNTSRGLDQIRAALPDTSILVLTTSATPGEAVQAIRHGADDCLTLDRLSANSFRQTVLNVIHRKQLLKDISAGGCEDAATGLYNLDGFKSLAQRLFDSCRQPRSKVYIVTFRVHGTAQITLARIADALRATCRKSETLALPSVSRVALEEFALLASADSLADVQHLLRRCEETFDKCKPGEEERVPWAVEFGMAAFDPEYPASPAVVLERARQSWKTIRVESRPGGAKGK
jgi:GGDEF domain-containing protein/CheY-like chemotaxis protein